jgi:hypothetical protein
MTKERLKMAGRGSALTRARQYFREAPLDEVEVAFELIKRDIAGRLAAQGKPTVTKTRKPRTPRAGATGPVGTGQESLANA